MMSRSDTLPTNVRTTHLRTPLHYAYIWQRDDTAKQLLARGGRELSSFGAAKDKASRTALD